LATFTAVLADVFTAVFTATAVFLAGTVLLAVVAFLVTVFLSLAMPLIPLLF
jgi:hypothetical protein